MLHNGGLNERLNTMLIWRTDTQEQWHSHWMQYIHNWCSAISGCVHMYGIKGWESKSLWYNMQHHVLEIHESTTLGASEQCRQCIPGITRDMKLCGSHSRLTNVLDLGDNWGLRPNNKWTNTLYESQRCDDVVKVKHVRHNHPERH